MEGLWLNGLSLLAGILAMAIFHGVLEANAKPKGRDLERLTQSSLNERVLAYRVCGACLADAEPSFLAKLVANAADADVDTSVGFIRKMTGGIWVGGRAILTTHRIVFLPNMLNRVLHEDLTPLAIALTDAIEVVHRFGIVTSIVDVKSTRLTITFRGYRMKSFVADIRRALGARDE